MGFNSDFAKIVSDNFSKFDGDGNNQISQFELEKAEANERLSQEARGAAHTLHEHFEEAKRMAGPQAQIDSGPDGRMKFGQLFIEADINAITKKDLAVMQLAGSDPSAIEELLNQQRSREKGDGIFGIVGGGAMLAVGLCFDAVGVIGIESPLALALIPGGILTIGGGAIAKEGWDNLTKPSAPIIREELTKRSETIESWNRPK